MKDTSQKKIIAMLAYRRPNYFSQVLTALENCLGIENYRLIVSIDGGYPEQQAEQQARLAASPIESETIIHKENKGIRYNFYNTLSVAFDNPIDSIIYLEDDTKPTRDFLIYMEQTLAALQPYQQVFSITGYSPTPSITPKIPSTTQATLHYWRAAIDVPFVPEKTPNAVALWRWYGGWGMGTWRDRWEEIVAKKESHRRYEVPGVDVGLAIRGQRLGAFPMVSRIQNIGAKQGIHAGYYDEQYTENMYTGDPILNFDLEPVTQFLSNHH